jgi:hypothetical protein
MTSMTASEILKQYIFLHNYGIEAGDFEPLMQIFNDNIVFAFEDPRIGVFEGIDSVRRVFRLQPPSIPIAICKLTETGNSASADYSDENKPDIPLGTISIDINGQEIARIFITSRN